MSSLSITTHETHTSLRNGVCSTASSFPTFTTPQTRSHELIRKPFSIYIHISRAVDGQGADRVPARRGAGSDTDAVPHHTVADALYRNRTCDQQLRRLLLYPSELRVLFIVSLSTPITTTCTPCIVFDELTFNPITRTHNNQESASCSRFSLETPNIPHILLAYLHQAKVQSV